MNTTGRTSPLAMSASPLRSARCTPFVMRWPEREAVIPTLVLGGKLAVAKIRSLKLLGPPRQTQIHAGRAVPARDAPAREAKRPRHLWQGRDLSRCPGRVEASLPGTEALGLACRF